jgi:quercetin dioxygenase-like cupin family protein
MKSEQLLAHLEFHQSIPFAQPLFVHKDGRVLRWILKPGQQITEYIVPSTPFYVVILKGHGMFAANSEQEQKFGPCSLIIFQPGETHSVRALEDGLIFVGFLQGAADIRPNNMRRHMVDASTKK